MGRELKRLPLDFEWPLHKMWSGYINQFYDLSSDCGGCDGTGYSTKARYLQELWYGHKPFKPEDRGSTPFLPDHPMIQERANRNAQYTFDHSRLVIFLQTQINEGEGITDRLEDIFHNMVENEAKRLCDLFNGSWSHHLNEADVATLIEHHRLYDLTHTWKAGKGWCPRDPPYVPTAREVNEWSIGWGLGHDGINQYGCVKAECERLGEPHLCAVCGGEGRFWRSNEDKQNYDQWSRTHPPTGDGYQMWETTSEGSPISPVFATALELATWLADNRQNTVDDGTSVETWLRFINGSGWAPSFVGNSDGIVTGVEGMHGWTS